MSATEPRDRIEGYGTIVLPEGMTPEQAEALAQAADEARRLEQEK